MTFAELKQKFEELQRVAIKATHAHHAALKTAEPVRMKANAALRAFETEPTEERAREFMRAMEEARAMEAGASEMFSKAQEAHAVARGAFERYDAVRRLRDASEDLVNLYISPQVMLDEWDRERHPRVKED